jgi:cupin 2 domain-containing protein
MRPHNVFGSIPRAAPEEQVATLLDAQNVRIERIVSFGQASPPGFWYDQPRAEWVVILSGSAGLRFEDEADTRTLRAGDFLLIAARRKHRVEWTQKDEATIWLAVHYDGMSEV